MGRNIYSKYSSYQQKVKKGKRNFLLLLVFSILLASVFFLGKNLKGKTIFNPPPADPDVDSVSEVVEDEPENLFSWWNYDYSSYRQLTVRNQEDREKIPAGSLVTLNINHKKLVDEGKALSSGNDIRLVHLSNNIYSELEIQLKDPGTIHTSIGFATANDIQPSQSDNNYFLYYGDPTATKYTSGIGDLKKSGLDYLVSYSKEKSPRLTASVNRKWVLKDDPDPRDFKFQVETNIEELSGRVQNVTYEVIGTNRTGFLTLISANKYEANVNAKDLIPGIYYIQASTLIDNLNLKSQKVPFYVSYPLYVTWTQDWEGYDVSDTFLNDMEEISSKHSMPITHFFNPRIYAASEISNARKSKMTQWVIDRKNTYGDEIALHLHMHYDLVSASGLKPKTQPAWGGRENGHDVLTSAYNYSEMMTILSWSKGQFEKNGLGKPTSFRSGGWFTGGDTLKALQDSGFMLDSSGRTPYDWGTNKIKGPWDLSSTTKPYRPSASDQNKYNASDSLTIWEFPNNGADSWTYTTNDLIQRFKDNYSGKPLEKKQVVTYLSHPHWFNVDKPKIDETLNYIDNYLYSSDKGPVKYITLEEAAKIWEKYPE